MVKNMVRSRVAKLQEYYGSHVSIGYDTINIDWILSNENTSLDYNYLGMLQIYITNHVCFLILQPFNL